MSLISGSPKINCSNINFPFHSNTNSDDISVMHEGSWMIIITKDNKIVNDLEYQPYYLSKDNENIYHNSTKKKLFSIKDIANVSKLDDEMLDCLRKILNVKGVSITGLRSLTFFIEFKETNGNKHCLYVIGENSQISYLWFQGIQTLWHNCLKSTVITSVSSTTSNRLVTTSNLYQSVKNIFNKFKENEQTNVINCVSNKKKNTNENKIKIKQNEDLVKSIEKDHHSISKNINDLYLFAAHFCILDSTEHLSLLSQAMKIKNMNDEIEYFLQEINKNNTNDYISKNTDSIKHIEALHYYLHAECTVVSLKSYKMKNDMKL